jgi:LuxR family maltose regulon positive regulatory protein
LLARVALAQGRALEADAILSKLLASVPSAQIGIRLELQALRAVLGHSAKSLLILRPALAHARVEGYRRVFLDEGPQMVALLQSAATRNIEAEVVQSLLSALDGTQAHVPTAEQALIEPLGETELEVLQLLALGLSNEEIAKERVVAVSTIKWHLKNIYGKLGVRNRTAAVARGKSLNLL